VRYIMARSLFDDMVSKKVADVPVAPRMIQSAAINPNAPILEAPQAEDYRTLGQKFADTIRTPITPAATLQLAQLAAAMAREGSWQSQVAQTVAGQEQQKINTAYVQDVLSGREPTPQEIKGVPLDVQLGARREVREEQAQEFEQQRRMYEFAIQKQLEQFGKMIEMQRVNLQKREHELNVSKFEEMQQQFEKQFANRKKYSSLGGLGVYNQETGQFIISKELLDAKRAALQASIDDETWDKLQSIGKQAAARGKQALQNQGLVLFDDEHNIIKIHGRPEDINRVYNEAYKEYVLRNMGTAPGQLPFTEEQVKWLAEMDFAADIATVDNTEDKGKDETTENETNPYVKKRKPLPTNQD